VFEWPLLDCCHYQVAKRYRTYGAVWCKQMLFFDKHDVPIGQFVFSVFTKRMFIKWVQLQTAPTDVKYSEHLT